MKVLYDYQAFSMQRFGGVSNSFIQLIKYLPEEVKYEISLRESDNVHIVESGITKVIPAKCVEDNFISTTKFKGRGFLYRQWYKLFPSTTSIGRNKQYSIEALIKGDYNVFHPTFFDDYFLPYLNGKPFVLTVHDMIPELFFKKPDIQIKTKPRLCKKAAQIIAVSEKTKSDLIDILKVPEKKVTVIYHGVPENVNILDTSPIVEGKYILYVGQRGLYKCFNQMLTQLGPVLNRHPELKIVCTGLPFTKKEMALMAHLGVKDRMVQLNPSDKELMNLYAHALCFIYPSIYEGFGIPILEAYKYQCPVLLNYKSCFPEIAQDAAIYFHLDDNQSDLEQVMEGFLAMSERERNELIERQNIRLKFFSWETSAKKMAEVYYNVL